MASVDLSKYCDVMEEIKRRIAVVDYFTSGGGHALFEPTTIEAVYLQLRKVLELIAMASLVANRNTLASTYENFSKTWNAELILKDIERLNPDFYPKPRTESPSPTPGVKAHWDDRNPDYLTRKDFVKLYKRCGSLMHADNPYGKKSNYSAFKSQIVPWRQKIINLLNTHTVQLVGDRNVYLINMQEAQDGLVHGYTFTPRE